MPDSNPATSTLSATTQNGEDEVVGSGSSAVHRHEKEAQPISLLHGRTELLRGDRESITIVYRNLTGQNPVSPGYMRMMEERLGIVIHPKKLRIKE